MLTEKQMQTRLKRYYKKHFGELNTDEWYVDPAPNQWMFMRDGKVIVLVCDQITGEIMEV